MLMGAFWGVYGADKAGSWVGGLLVAMLAGGLLALVHAFFAIHLRADQIVGGTAVNFLALGITGYFFFQLYHGQDVPVGVSTIPNVNIPCVERLEFLGPAIGDLNLMVWLSFLLVIVSYIVVFKTPIGLRIRACGEHPRAADTVGINVYARPLRLGDPLGHPRGARRRVPLDRLRRRGVHRQHDRRPRLHRPRGDDLRQLAAVRHVLRGAAVRLLDRARVPSAGVLGLGGDALPDAAVRPHADRRRRRVGRTVPPAADGKPYVRQ